MRFNKVCVFSFVILLLTSIGCYLYYQYETNPTFLRSSGAFSIHTTATETPLCGNDEVIRTRDNLHIVTLRMCENNITGVTSENDWVTVQTNCGIYRKNIKTGKDELEKVNCLGGFSKVR